MNRYAGPRYPVLPLALLLGHDETGQRTALHQVGVSGAESADLVERGLTERRADFLANRAGFIAYDIWPEMLNDSISSVERACACPGCPNTFIPGPRAGKKRYCSRNCNQRVLERRRYWANPERKRAAQRRYDAAVREARAERARSAA